MPKCNIPCAYNGGECPIVCRQCPHKGQESQNRSKKVPKIANERPKMTKAEAEYGLILQAEFPGSRIDYEGITLKLRNMHRYTPDWIVQIPEGILTYETILLVEVKVKGANGFRQASYGRAKLAYDQAKLDYPYFQFRWVEKFKGQWIIGGN